MNQRGAGEVYLIAGVVVISMGAAIAIQTYRLNEVKEEYALFKGGVEALGKAAETAAKVKEAKDKLAKEKADADKKRLTTDLAATVKRLRDANSRRSAVSQLPATASSPKLAAFDRTELDRAIQDYQSEILGVVEKGAEAIVDLDSAKNWIKEVQ